MYGRQHRTGIDARKSRKAGHDHNRFGPWWQAPDIAPLQRIYDGNRRVEAMGQLQERQPGHVPDTAEEFACLLLRQTNARWGHARDNNMTRLLDRRQLSTTRIEALCRQHCGLKPAIEWRITHHTPNAHTVRRTN